MRADLFRRLFRVLCWIEDAVRLCLAFVRRRRSAVTFQAPPTPAASPIPASFVAAQLEAVEARLLKLPQGEYPVTHRFGPGVYLRSVVMPAGHVVLGHEHLTDHFNVMLRGRARVLCGGEVLDLTAPAVFRSAAGVRKVLYILETTEWLTVHPTPETDLATLEAALVRKSETWMLHASEVEKLKGGES